MRRLFTLFVCGLLAVSTALAYNQYRTHRYDSFKVIEPAEGSIIFLGNSITDMHCWPEAFVTSDGNYLPIVNRGVSGTYSTQQSEHLESYLKNKPSKVFMMIGTNDIATSGGLNFSPEQVLQYVKSIVERIHMRSPETKIYLYSILNNNTGNRVEATWLHANEITKQYVESMNVEWLTYIDLYEPLINVGNGGVWCYDGIHLTAASYEIWCQQICKYLAEGEEYTVSTVYPGGSSTKQQNCGDGSSVHGMRATYFSMMPVNSSDILVFGDEMIRSGEWQELLGNLNVKNRGTGWGYGGNIALTSKMVDATFASTGVKKEAPKAIFIYTGTEEGNNTANMETVKSSYKALVDKIAAKAPNAKIYLMGLLPTGNASNNTSRIQVLNSYLASLATGNIRYVDTYTPLASGNTANSKYFAAGNLLGGIGYVKVANAMKEAIAADFPQDEFTTITEEEATKRHTQAGLRNSLTKAIASGLMAERGTAMGQYDPEKMEAFDAALANANALLAKDELTAAEVNEEIAKLAEILNNAQAMPQASSGTDEYWYQITSQRSPSLYITADGAAAGVWGKENTAGSATSMWKFVDRGDNTYDIVNREYESYLNPVANYNTQIQTVTTRPSKGWTIGCSGTPSYFIISSGDVQLNQTGSGQSYALYNWSNSNSLGNDLTDQGCQLKIMDAQELVEEPDYIEYTVDKANGNLYRGALVNQSWNNVWKSNTTPQLQFGCGTINNMEWVGNNIRMMTGTATRSTYTITPPAGYVISEYSFTFANNGHTNALTLTMDNGNEYTTGDEQTISAKNQSLSSVSFTLAGANTNGVLLTDFTVKVKADKPMKPQISTDDDVHWYYIANASSKAYCSGKVIYYDNGTSQLRFGEKSFTADRIWSFWEKDGKIAIKNYKGEYFGTAGPGTGGSTAFGVVSEPNYIYSITDAYGFFIIKDDAVELHAQEAGSVIVRWRSEADNASLWRFDEVDTSNALAELASTKVEQGKISTGIGNTDQPIVRSTIRISGLEGNINFQGVKGTFAGTDKNDVTNVKAYFATNARELFIDPEQKMTWREENGEQFGEAVTIGSDGTFTITGNKELESGNHYLWITYDIADDAKEGNKVDVNITGYTIDGEEVAEKNGNPAHDVTIFLSEGAVLMPMDKGTAFYRIPSITVTKDGKRLVTLTDDRKGHGGDLPSHCYLVAQYSDDNGKTWSEPVTVAGTAELGGNYGHGDASIVTNRDNGDIIGIMTSAGTYGHGFWASTAAQPQRWKTIISRDNGLTWEAPVDHTDDLYGAACPNPVTKTWKGGFSGSGAALQKRDGTLVSSFVNRDANDVRNFHFFMSDDGGESWYVSGTSGTTNADEPKTLERNNGDLAISVRATGYNYYNYTSDNGATWHMPSQTRFTSGISGNACDGEYMVWCSTLEGNPWNVALQTLPNNGQRQNVSIALSTDEGATFGTPKTICPRGSAYSAAVVLPDGTLGVYYEENGLYNGFVLRFVRFSLDWASNGRFKFTEENPFYPIKSTKETSIECIQEVISGNVSNGIYDLQGRKLDEITEPGIYIIDGNKVLVK